MSLRERPTAVLCSNDVMAIGVLREAFEIGVRMPDDLSVVGFDNIKLSEFVPPFDNRRTVANGLGPNSISSIDESHRPASRK